ncbi:hypothetical protein UFOVP424_2 [uncultured Caudovirales phage]|uniref:Uncharacterized protein n=1 Tax=uncultured Caudovirales phage TaxID=2100421 RepID=A0A6J5M6A3_9CAUD|nr:hypothetical protein UFOVP424_2 [uncultured Caudovirales phage]
MMKFKYKGKEYQVEEPTVEMWSKLVLLQDWTDEREFCMKLLSFTTGLTEEEIENSDYMEVVKLSTEISTFLTQDGDKFYNEFSFNGKNYRFLDLPNLTFGEFIDIDTYLNKEPHEKKKDMPLMMAMLYRELDENGNYKPYNSKELLTKAEEFKKLPVKYVRGSTNFFFHLGKTLQGNFKGSFWLKLRLTIKMLWILVKFVPLISFGAGSLLLSRWRTKILQKSKKLLNIR